MKTTRRTISLLGAGIGVAAALLTAPAASAIPGEDNPLLPGCETTGGSSISGGQTTDCASPGNSQITATPQFFPGEEYYGMPFGFGFGY